MYRGVKVDEVYQTSTIRYSYIQLYIFSVLAAPFIIYKVTSIRGLVYCT
jgi:hypothetical protein